MLKGDHLCVGNPPELTGLEDFPAPVGSCHLGKLHGSRWEPENRKNTAFFGPEIAAVTMLIDPENHHLYTYISSYLSIYLT
jgi:hypothetical protein